MSLIVAACLTLTDVRNAECRIYCKGRGYDSGAFAHDLCWCADKHTYERTSEKRLFLPNRKGPHVPLPAYTPEPKVDWSKVYSE